MQIEGPGSGARHLARSGEAVSEVRHHTLQLACYWAQLGNLERAKVFLETAFEIGNSARLKAMALSDPDLEPLWKEIGKVGSGERWAL